MCIRDRTIRGGSLGRPRSVLDYSAILKKRIVSGIYGLGKPNEHILTWLFKLEICGKMDDVHNIQGLLNRVYKYVR